MVKSLVIAAAIAAATGPVASPDAPRTSAGEWRLSDAGGKIACTLTLSDEHGVAGNVVKVPLACRRAFPPLKDLAAWVMDPQGAIVFSDPTQNKIATFTPQPGAPYEAKTPEGKTWRLEPSHAPHLLSARERMTGAFRLSGPGGAVLCDLTLTANLFGNGGSVSHGQCAAPWSDKAFAVWSLQGGRLTLFDKTRKALLVMKTSDPTTFVANSPKAEVVTLARK